MEGSWKLKVGRAQKAYFYIDSAVNGYHLKLVDACPTTQIVNFFSINNTGKSKWRYIDLNIRITSLRTDECFINWFTDVYTNFTITMLKCLSKYSISMKIANHYIHILMLCISVYM